MFKKINIVSLLMLLFVSNILSAQGCCVNPFYARVEVGGAFPACGRINGDYSSWGNDGDGDGDGNRHRLRATPLFGLELGVNVNSWFAFGFSATNRGVFKHCQTYCPTNCVTTTTFPVSTFPLNSCCPQTDCCFSNPDRGNNFLDLDEKTRRFDFENYSFMFDLYFNRSGYNSWGYRFCDMALVPYFGFGVGWARNTVSNSHTIVNRPITIGCFSGCPVGCIDSYVARNRFAWDAQVGLDYYINRCVAIGIGYRYFDGGCVKSNDHVILTREANRFEGSITKCPWHFKFRTHEVVGTLSLEF